MTPRGGLLLCEDAAGGANIVGERLVGLTLDGQTFTFAQNNVVLTQQQTRGGGQDRRAGRLPHQRVRRRLLQPGRRSGCSSTSRRRGSRSPSPVRGGRDRFSRLPKEASNLK